MASGWESFSGVNNLVDTRGIRSGDLRRSGCENGSHLGVLNGK